jgi:hypothetical protein
MPAAGGGGGTGGAHLHVLIIEDRPEKEENP